VEERDARLREQRHQPAGVARDVGHLGRGGAAAEALVELPHEIASPERTSATSMSSVWVVSGSACHAR
jgi:hypothetical protein